MRRVSAMKHAGAGLEMLEPAQAFRPFERDQRVGVARAMVGDHTSLPKRTWLNTMPPRLAMPCTSLCLTWQALVLPSSAMTLRSPDDALAADADDHDVAGRAGRHGGPRRGRGDCRGRVHCITGWMQSEGQTQRAERATDGRSRRRSSPYGGLPPSPRSR